jgi:hypothetical protein
MARPPVGMPAVVVVGSAAHRAWCRLMQI